MSATTTEHDIAKLMGELATPAGQADPYPIYARMHGLGEAVAAPDGTAVVTGYRACSTVIRDNRLRKYPGAVLTAAGYPDWEQRPSLRMLFGSMLMLNPPQHTRLRRLVSRSFTAHRVASMREAITRIAGELCEPLHGTIEFVDAVAFPFPVTVIGELLGIPAADRAMFQPLVRDRTSVLEILNPLAVDSADTAAIEIQTYLGELVRARQPPRNCCATTRRSRSSTGAPRRGPRTLLRRRDPPLPRRSARTPRSPGDAPMLLQRFPNACPAGDPVRREGLMIRGYTSLRIALQG